MLQKGSLIAQCHPRLAIQMEVVLEACEIFKPLSNRTLKHVLDFSRQPQDKLEIDRTDLHRLQKHALKVLPAYRCFTEKTVGDTLNMIILCCIGKGLLLKEAKTPLLRHAFVHNQKNGQDRIIVSNIFSSKV
jgi:hypothetical protein